MIDRQSTCCFTGHRPSKLPWGTNEDDPRCGDLKKRIHDAVEAVHLSGVRHYICGMAPGCDLYFCRAVMELRTVNEEITIEAAIPFEGQADRWDEELKNQYYRLVSECDFETVVQKSYTPDCMMRRNRYMVDSSSVLIAASSGRTGGTMSTMLHAMRSGVEIIELPIEG